MQPILSFNDLTEHLKQLHRTFRLAVVCGSDASTAEAVMRAVDHGFAEACKTTALGGTRHRRKGVFC